MTHLFLFTLTPVQSFISQARKTQDLWAGSRMLSDFIGKVYEAIIKEGGTVIFPSKKSASMPNRILASFNFSKTDRELKELGKKIADEVAIVLHELTKKAASKIGATEYAKIKNAFENQLKDYFSTFWVFVPVENNNYADAYDKADRLLGAVKNSRTFTQYPEQGRKCSLSGEQNALVFKYIEESKESDETREDLQKRKEENRKKRLEDLQRKFVDTCALVDDDSFDDGEGLSAISFIKRFYPFNNQRKSFDSTTDIALLKSIQEAPQAFQDFENIFDILKAAEQEKYLKINGKKWTPFNEQFLYEENLTSKNIPCKQQLEIAQKAHKKLRNALKEKGLKFTKYYAILLFDADSMGAWLSGEYLNDRENKLHDFHTHLSGLLSGFAEYAKRYVDGELTEEDKKKNPELKSEDLKTKKGRTVYAGGDDYLGFINLHYLFEVMKHLREQFKVQVSDKIPNNGQFTLKGKDEMTFSAGIAIAHYKTPLSEVLTWARKMEKEAKDYEKDKKDKFGIAVLKKSGEIHKAVLPFKTFKKDREIWYSELMREVREGLETHFSSNYITVLQKEMQLLAEREDTRITQIMNFEIERLILRAKNKATREEANEMAEKVMQVYEPNIRNIRNFNASLSICDFINRKLQGND